MELYIESSTHLFIFVNLVNFRFQYLPNITDFEIRFGHFLNSNFIFTFYLVIVYCLVRLVYYIGVVLNDPSLKISILSKLLFSESQNMPKFQI